MKRNKFLQKIIKKLVGLSFKDGKLIEVMVTRSIKILKSFPRADAIEALSEYLRLLKRKERDHTLYIESTTPLSPSQISKVRKIVEKKNKITKVLVNLNPDILGGFKLRVGDEIWDETISGKILQIKEAIQG